MKKKRNAGTRVLTFLLAFSMAASTLGTVPVYAMEATAVNVNTEAAGQEAAQSEIQSEPEDIQEDTLETEAAATTEDVSAGEETGDTPERNETDAVRTQQENAAEAETESSGEMNGVSDRAEVIDTQQKLEAAIAQGGEIDLTGQTIELNSALVVNNDVVIKGGTLAGTDNVTGNLVNGVVYGKAKRWWGTVINGGKAPVQQISNLPERIG